MNTFKLPMLDTIHKGALLQTRGCILSIDQMESKSAKESAERLLHKQQMEAEIAKRSGELSTNLKTEQRQKCAKCEKSIQKTFVSMESDIRRQLIGLSMQIAEIILRRELPDKEMLQKVIADILDPISDLRGVKIKLCPQDRLRMHGESSPNESCSPGIEWVEDPALKPGDVLVESRNGYFDGRLKERLAVLAEALETVAANQAEPASPGLDNHGEKPRDL